MTVTTIRLSEPLLKALAHLLRAHEYAGDTGVDPWQFAVEWRVLKSAGVEPTDARWLIARRLVDFRREITIPLALHRTFIVLDVARLTPDSAFILTDTGAAYCRSLFQENVILENVSRENSAHSRTVPTSLPESSTARLPNHHPTNSESSPRDGSPARPHWDPDRRELTFHGQLVKRFRVPAPNQELILTAFQEESWPEFIHDPLPPAEDIDPHRRLQSTIKSLNRHQMDASIRFRGNGGEMVFWDAVKG